MIKFFRKIRTKLLSENKFSKYLIYVLGEIILIVIGILIALSINNWNENRKESKLEKIYLTGIKDDLEKDIEQAKIVIDEHLKQLNDPAMADLEGSLAFSKNRPAVVDMIAKGNKAKFYKDGTLLEIPVEEISSKEKFSRKHYSKNDIESMAESIKEQGVLQTIDRRPGK